MINRDTEIVSKVRACLEAELGLDRFELWFESGTALDWTDDGLRITADSEFRVERLRKSLLGEITRVVQKIAGEGARVVFDVDRSLAVEAASAEVGTRPGNAEREAAVSPVALATESSLDNGTQKPLRHAPSNSPWRREGGAGRRFASLQTLVRGKCNALAVSAAEMVLQDPGKMNPLFVHGPSGSGKTHLLEGIWSEARRRGGRRIIYLSAEQFTTYFLQALRGSGLPSFRQKYRAVDLLILDDVQFFAGKQATINEMLHTLDALLRESRQIVLAADRSPSELMSLGQELPARISGGIVCQLQPLDVPTRCDVLQQLALQRSLTISGSLASRIAERTTGDARQLAGFMNRLWATCQAIGESPSAALVDQLLDELFPNRGSVVRLDDIQRVICEEFGIDQEQLKSDGRSRRISQPRMLAMWLARKHTRAALTEIGEFFGRRSHSTVVSAQQKVDQWFSQGERLVCDRQESDIRALVSRLEQSLRA